MTHPSDHPFRIAAVALPAALGMVFCLLNAAGADLLCLTSGCGIYAGYSLGGVSIHLLGAIGFGIILLLSLLSLRWGRLLSLLFAVLVAGLLIDTLFLVWQILYWPCLNCLVVALLLALCVLGALKVFPSFRSTGVKLALLLWLASFMPVAADACKEIFLQPWPAAGNENAPVAVYFSPTCPACKETVQEILDLPDLDGQVAFYPLAKNTEDLRRLARMMEGTGEKTELEKLFSPSGEQGTKPGAALRWKLARNKMALARLGVDTVPLVLTPRLVQTAPALNFPFSGGGTFPSELFNIPLMEGCSADSPVEEACD